jgi:hypothetical protein
MARLVKTRYFLDTAYVKKRLGEGVRKALTKAGAMVYRSCQKQFLTGRKSKSPTFRQIGEWQGKPLVEQQTRKPKPGRITSWRTRRSPKGFMRSSLGFEYDFSTKSVVVGPRRNRWLNVMHEKGGGDTQRLYLRRRGKMVSAKKLTGRAKFNGATKVYVGTFLSSRTRGRAWLIATARTRSIRVRSSKFQAKGLEKVRTKIPSKFKDCVSGP